MARVPNLPPSLRGKGYKGASQKPLNIKRANHDHGIEPVAEQAARPD